MAENEKIRKEKKMTCKVFNGIRFVIREIDSRIMELQTKKKKIYINDGELNFHRDSTLFRLASVANESSVFNVCNFLHRLQPMAYFFVTQTSLREQSWMRVIARIRLFDYSFDRCAKDNKDNVALRHDCYDSRGKKALRWDRSISARPRLKHQTVRGQLMTL